MKTKSTLLTLMAAAGLFGATAIAADTATDSTTTPPPRHRLHRAAPAQAAEIAAYHEKVLAIYDVDKNGLMDEDERAVHRDHIRAGTFPAPPFAGHLRRHRGPPAELVAQYDANKDGALDETEHAALRADIEAGKVQRPRWRHREPSAPADEVNGKPSTGS
jgi:hypothetical protein